MIAAGPAGPGDIARQVVTVVGAVAQAALPALLLPRVRRDLRPPEVAQPAPWAFTIWLPIYAVSAAHAVRQARPTLRADPLLRSVGWPLATAFVGIGAWAPLVYRRRYWPAQAALGGTALLAGVARARLSRAPAEAVAPSLALTTGLLAGWGAAACGVNLAAMLVGAGPVAPGRPATATGAATALALGGLGAVTLPAGASNTTQRAYAATLVWALAGVADGRRRDSPPIAAAAALAAVPVVRRML